MIDEDLISDLVRLLLRYASRANGSGELGAGSDVAEAAPAPRDLLALLGRSALGEAAEPGPLEPPTVAPPTVVPDDSKNVRPGRRLREDDPAPRPRSAGGPGRAPSAGSPFSSPEDPAWGFWRQAIYLPEDEIEEEARDLVRWLELRTAPSKGRAAAHPGIGEE